jgi:C1A family cysteine protease
MKFTATATLIATIASASAVSFDGNVHNREVYEAKMIDWMNEHNIQLSGTEFSDRLKIFADAEDHINAHNSAGKSWKMAHNQFSHLTKEEFREAAGLGVNIPKHIASKTGMNPLRLPKETAKTGLRGANLKASSVDWVDSGAVTGVKDQGSCGSCWSFSTTGAIEGAYQRKTGELVSFSEQNLVSCDTMDSACNGGLMDYAFQWIQENGGLCKESDYPYVSGGGSVPSCDTSCEKVEGSAVTKWTDVDQSDEALMEALDIGPVAIAIEADESNFQYYSSGVLTASCGSNLDHGVLAVGYGTMDGTDYYRVKNSWGTSWGDNGYIYFERGGNAESAGKCGILSAASYPTL